MDRKPCVWSYIVVFDGGTAPCVDNQSLSLCICKPLIRKNAIVGDWIIGFARKKIGENLIVYATEVKDKISMEDYFLDPKVRKDKIYKFLDNKFIHNGSDIHNSPKNWASDLNGKFCLTSEKFWYFGNDPIPVPDELQLLYYPFVGQKKFNDEEVLLNTKSFFETLDVGIYAEPTD